MSWCEVQTNDGRKLTGLVAFVYVLPRLPLFLLALLLGGYRRRA